MYRGWPTNLLVASVTQLAPRSACSKFKVMRPWLSFGPAARGCACAVRDTACSTTPACSGKCLTLISVALHPMVAHHYLSLLLTLLVIY